MNPFHFITIQAAQDAVRDFEPRTPHHDMFASNKPRRNGSIARLARARQQPRSTRSRRALIAGITAIFTALFSPRVLELRQSPDPSRGQTPAHQEER